jgi:beta-lactamase regulating signal transducer with metallopeptidase domain
VTAIGDLAFAWVSIAPAVVAWLLTFAIHSTLLLGTVWLVSRYVRSYRLKDILWKTALVGGMLTATLQVAVGLKPLTGRFDLSPGSTSVLLSQERGDGAPVTMTEAQRVNDADLNLDQGTTGLVASAGILGPAVDERTTWHTLTLLRRRLAAALWRGAGWLFGLWLVGAAVANLRLGLARRRLHARLDHRRDVTGPLTDTLTHLRCVAGVRHPVRLTCSSTASSPMLLKAREICLPQQAITGLCAEQQKSLLAHELAHVVRHDSIWLIVVNVLGCLFFFQPLFRLARRRMRECAEYLCDDLAARYTDSGLNLARCLVEVAGWLPSHTRLVTVASMAENVSSLERRIRRLLDGSWSERSEALRWWWALAVVGVLVLVGVAGPGVSAKAGSSLPANVASVERGTDQPGPWEIVAQMWDKSAVEESNPREVVAWAERNGGIRVSLDGEHSSQVVPPPTRSGPIAFVSFVDSQTGWAASPRQPSLWATSDGGRTWAGIVLPEGVKHIAAVQLRTARDGYLLSTAGILYITQDRGKHWSSQALELNGEGMFIPEVTPSAAMHFSDSDHGLVVVSLVGGGRGEVLAMRTADGGRTWRQETVPVESGTLFLSNHGTILRVEGWLGQKTVLRYEGLQP